MQTVSITHKDIFEKRTQKDDAKRLTPSDYSEAGILKNYDWSVKGREEHDEEMAKYRQCLMNLCQLSHEIGDLINPSEK